MKKKILALTCCLALGIGLLAGCSSGGSGSGSGSGSQTPSGSGSQTSSDAKIALITMDSIDQHWVTLNEGAQKAAKELGVTVDFMAPNTKDDALQIEQVNNAVAGGYDAILVAANGPDAISGALKEAAAAGVKIVYVDSPANVDAAATFSTDNAAAGKRAGEEMLKALNEKEQWVISRRYGLEDGRPCTLEEIGEALGVTRERVRQIEKRAMEKLRKNAK